MNYFLAVIFGAAGLACFIWYKKLYRSYAKFMGKRFHEEFGRLAEKAGWDDPNDPRQLILYKSSVITAGVALLALAFHFAFGTIHIGA